MPSLLTSAILCSILMVKPGPSESALYAGTQERKYVKLAFVDDIGGQVRVLSEKRVDSLILCSGMCSLNQRCKAFDFQHSDNMCTTYRMRMFNDTEFESPRRPSAGLHTEIGYLGSSNLESGCLKDSDCPAARNFVCFEKTCKCVPGYSFNRVNSSCVRRCKSYSNNFTTYQGLSIAQHNDGTRISQTQESCLEACISENTFQCISYEFMKDIRMCYISKSGYLDVQASDRQKGYKGWTFAMRNCITTYE